MGDIKRESLTGRWYRSNEEDQGKQLVYRLQGFKFPPSRGRESFELKADGNLIRHGFGPTDKTTKAAGTWKLQGDVLALHEGAQSVPTQKLKIVSATPDRLVVES